MNVLQSFSCRLAVALVLATAGCKPARAPSVSPPLTGKARIPNPLRGGRIVPQTLVVHSHEENIYALPDGSLKHEGVLESADAETACFVITLRQMGPRAKFTTLEAWARISLRVDDRAPIGKPSTTRVEEAHNDAMGRTTSNEHVGQSFQCGHRDSTGNCDQRVLAHTYADVTRDVKIDLTAATHRLCFATGASLTPTSRTLVLELEPPRSYEAPDGVRMHWELEP